MTRTPINPAGELAARLLYLNQQQAQLKKEADEVKQALEELYTSDAIARQNDADVLFSDGTYHKVRIQRKAMGKYFKVLPEYKEDFSTEKHKLEAKYLKAEKAEMADKACTWVVQEVKQ
jgi:hypothetical protein